MKDMENAPRVESKGAFQTNDITTQDQPTRCDLLREALYWKNVASNNWMSSGETCQNAVALAQLNIALADRIELLEDCGDE